MKKGTIAIFSGGIAFMIVGIIFMIGRSFTASIVGVIIIAVGIVIAIGGYQDYKRLQKLDNLKKWDK